jgi:hypothetical protein
MHQVPGWNKTGNIRELVGALERMCGRVGLDTRNYYELLAITRDIGILAGSIRRHGEQPNGLVPQLDGTLLQLGVLTDLIPRDTLMHYTVWNPVGPRLRRYTDNCQELALIESISRALPAIRRGTRLIFATLDLDLSDPAVPQHLSLVAHCLKEFLAGLHIAVKQVAPAVFIQHFRPFFESYRVGPNEYRGPGAVTMPLHILDFLLWGSSEPDHRYQQFTADYIPYNTGEFRSMYLRARNRPSLLSRLISGVERLQSNTDIWQVECHICWLSNQGTPDRRLYVPRYPW